MNVNNLVNNLSFKKIAVIFLIFLAANWLIHEFFMWSYFNKFQQTMIHFNDQFNQDQARIHNKIVESEKESDKWNKAFDQKQNEFHELVDKGMKENLEFLQNSHNQMAEQQKEFDKKFAEMPGKMWETHKAFANQAADVFEEHGKRMDELRTKQLSEDMKKDNARHLDYTLKKKAEDRNNWEAARLRYHEENGVWLPNYDQAFKRK